MVRLRIKLRDQLVDLGIKIGTGLCRTRDNQRRARLVDQNRIDFIDNCKIELSQHLVSKGKGKVVAQIVETEFVVSRVGDIAVVRGALLFLRLTTLRHPDRQAEEFINRAHPVGVALGEVLVDRDDMHASAADRIEIGRQRCDQGLALTGAHLGDVAIVQHHAADQLNIERSHL